MYLEKINGPADVKALNSPERTVLAAEMRTALIQKLSHHGGHCGPNLGLVEATIALHTVFDSPKDRFVFDVSHQTYPHKMLTGRSYGFLDPARYDDITGYSAPQESAHDPFTLGHTSTSVSLACGLAKARDAKGEHHNVVAIIGDGSLSGGEALEGLDLAGEMDSNLIIVVNDNGMSIAENHGGIYKNLELLRQTGGKAECNLFRAMGLDYVFQPEGNNTDALIETFQQVKGCDHPVVVHIVTEKGKGYAPAETHKENWHWCMPFDPKTGESTVHFEGEDYGDLTARYLLEEMQKDPKVVAITSGTPTVFGFTEDLRKQAGKQFMDVGIAEEHAVTFATALARSGAKPVFGVYGTFLQRAYDELWHDLCLNDAPATILVFGASIFGTTSETHLSFFDISMLGGLPNMHYLAPACMEEYLSMLSWSLDHREHPAAIRVPGIGLVSRPDLAPAEDTDYSAVRYNVVRQGRDVAVLALGDFFELGERVANRLAAEYGIEATLVNPRFATELDREFLDSLAAEHRVVVTLEDGILDGGWGERVACYLACTPVRTRTFGIAKGFPDRYDPNELLAQNGMTVENMAAEAARLLKQR